MEEINFEKLNKFNSLINDKGGENLNVAIFMHKTPDADAIGSAVGLQWFLYNQFKISAKIFHGGEISHPENKTMVNVLNYQFGNINDILISDFDYTITVDGTEKNTIKGKENVDLIIDHHDITVNEESHDGVYIDSSMGSCCSMISDLIQSSNLEFLDADDNIPTALLFGLIKDTNHLLSDNVSSADFEAYKFLSKYANRVKINSIQSYPLPAYIFELESLAMNDNNYFETDATFVTFIGYIPPSKRDVLPYLADKYMRKEGISTTVITAVIGDTIQASVRTSNVSLVLKTFIHKIFGEDYGGAKSGAGGAAVPLGFFSLKNDDEKLKQESLEFIKNKIFGRVKREISNDS